MATFASRDRRHRFLFVFAPDPASSGAKTLWRRMAKGTKIEWADDTVNAEMGCDGCELWDPKNSVRSCYAGVQTERMLSKGQLKRSEEHTSELQSRLHLVCRLLLEKK